MSHLKVLGDIKMIFITRRKTATDKNNEIRESTAVVHNPSTSIRSISRSSEISRMNVQRILKRHKFHPYRVSLK